MTSAQKLFLAEMLGTETENVDFTETLPASTPILPITEPGESIEITAEKLRALAAVVGQRRASRCALDTRMQYMETKMLKIRHGTP